ncbi:EAL domain-containing protein [Mesobacillus zeae]|uniref:EAL domain-containing protein n=1 Tax=Mesobacillus zeae TaxID=1917180 RepID=A0A398BIT7_9BACI|nr:EAL domain-containing protein [Mesobacillus zeae]RID88911.1 EAL domain-containing protein [Mesobacillus zeae]
MKTNTSPECSETIEQLLHQINLLKKREENLLKDLRIKENLNVKILDALPINIFLEDSSGRTIFANEQVCKAHGMELQEIIGKTVFDFFPEGIAESNRNDDLKVWEQRKLLTREVLASFKGSERQMFSGKTIITMKESAEDYLLGFALDITDRVNAEKLLQENEEIFRNLIEQAADSFFLIGLGGRLENVNTIACEVLGYEKDSLLELTVDQVFSLLPYKLSLLGKSQTEKAMKFEDEMISHSHGKIPVDINLQQIQLGGRSLQYAWCRDIRDKKKAEAQIQHMAFHDALTGLPNRWFIQTYLKHFLDKKKLNSKRLAILMLDLDHFKIINDSLGHEAGDMLLKAVALRLQETAGSDNIVARLGGDEFIMLIPCIGKQEDAHTVAEEIMAALKEPFHLYGQWFSITASIGLCFCPDDGTDMNILIKNADIAMYKSKEKGRNCLTWFTPVMKEHAMERLDLEIALRQAIQAGEFVLHYQPKMNIKTGKIYGIEALIRWKKGPDLLYPDTFISILEETGMIIPVGEWVIREACSQCARWHQAGLSHLSVSVNLSAKQFQHPQLDVQIAQILKETGLPPSSLELELTESLLMDHSEKAARMLNNLKSLGISISIDDFGTGFSSLNYLKYLPIDTLKIDKTFIMNSEHDRTNAAIASAVISLAHSLNLKVVAEGVETPEQLELLHNGQCNYAQGYYISYPLQKEDVEEFLVFIPQKERDPE